MAEIALKLETSKSVIDAKLPVIQLSSANLDRDHQIISKNDNETPKIFISTNVIETGYTINHLSFVIDCMKFKQVYRNPVSKVLISRELPIDQ